MGSSHSVLGCRKTIDVKDEAFLKQEQEPEENSPNEAGRTGRDSNASSSSKASALLAAEPAPAGNNTLVRIQCAIATAAAAAFC